MLHLAVLYLLRFVEVVAGLGIMYVLIALWIKSGPNAKI
jgi:hypothetical protein